MSTELMTELLEAGVHFGHQSKRWNPKMKPFIFEKRNALHIINLGTTVHQLDAATKFLGSIAARGGKILFVGCKKQAQEAVIEAAQACGHYYVNQRWLGGTLTNRATVRKSVARMIYIEQLEKQPEYSKMGNQEISALRREGEKLKRNLEGIRTMEKLPDAMIVIDTVREGIAIQEAKRLKIPTVAIVDTNADPDLVTYPIAGNDDAIRAIRVVLQKLVDAIVTGSGGHAVPAAPEAAVEGVIRINACFVRKMGFEWFVDIHIGLDGNQSVYEGHDIAHVVVDRIKEKFPQVYDVLTHIEPHEDNDPIS